MRGRLVGESDVPVGFIVLFCFFLVFALLVLPRQCFSLAGVL
jgi:hypothetical protein